MADNTQLNVGTLGDIIATDDIAGVKHQMVKIEYGALDSATLVSAANPLPIVQTGTPALPTGASTEATLALIKAKTDNIPAQGQALAAASTPVVLTAAQITTLTPPAQGLTDTQLRATAVPVSLATAPTTPVTGTFWQATQPVSGTVTANIGTSGSLALDATLTGGTQKAIARGGAKGATVAADLTSNPIDANTQALHVDGSKVTQPVSGTFFQATQPVSLATNTPTIAAGTAVIGKVGIDQTTPGTTNLVALAANQSVNNAQINGIAPLMGNGVTGTGSQRVTIASDNTPHAVKIDQTTPGTTNAVTDTKLPASAASADALANPTITQIGADNMLFNGTSWDRQRGMSVATTTGDTGAKTATGNGATQTNVGNKGIQIVLAIGAVTGTAPTFVMKVQGSVDGGTNFYDIPGAVTASLVATGVWGITLYPGATVTAGTTVSGTTAGASTVLPRTWRVVWTIGGTTPSFTITSITYNYIPN